ncbi:MAG: serine/threonine-protein kinase [Chthoniobacteraceae bacterium]
MSEKPASTSAAPTGSASHVRHLLHVGLTSAHAGHSPLAERRGGLPEPETPLMASGKWGDYEIIQKISNGGMGMVYLAWQPSLDRFVALKFLLPELNAMPQFVERFRREAKAAASLRHPNIVSVHEVGAVDGQLFFSMDFIEGRNLAEVIREGSLPWRQAARYCRIIASAIDYAHSRWVLHRDLKPSNVLIDLHDQPQVADFGLAGKMEVRSHLTLTNHILGSPNYLSPEQAGGQMDDVSAACDIHAIGVILYECLSGRQPFQADTLQETLLRIREQKPTPLRATQPELPRDIETICMKCLEKDQSRRYLSAQDLAADLERCLAGEPIQARRPSRAGQLTRWIQRHPRMALVYAASLVLMLSCLAILGLENRRMAKSIMERERHLAEAYVELGRKWLEDRGKDKAVKYFRQAAELTEDQEDDKEAAEEKNHAWACPILSDRRQEGSNEMPHHLLPTDMPLYL